VSWLLCTTCFGADYALVVGANECINYRPKGVSPRPLGGAEYDAEAFRDDLLLNHYRFPIQKVHSLIGAKATYHAIETEFKWFQENLSPADQFVFYFAGHGTQVPNRAPYPLPHDTDKELDGADEALCPFDAATENRVENGAPYPFAVNLIVDDQLGEWLERIPARRITVILDCCHAGTAVKGKPADKIRKRSLEMAPLAGTTLPPHNPAEDPWRDLRAVKKDLRRTIVAFYACGSDRPAVERHFHMLAPPRQQRGQFTKLLIDCLSNRRDDPSLLETSDFIRDEIEKWAGKDRSRQDARQQNPTFEPLREGDLPLILREGGDKKAAPPVN
jgi:hypothetical protein